jgi:23S rRNA (pseudouridine1915-N3)-methyltransferase
MKINVISVSHKQPSWAEAACQEYLKRFQRDFSVALTDIKPAFRSGSKEKNQLARQTEKERIYTQLSKGSCLVALDEHGDQLNSKELASLLTKLMNEGTNVDFVIGGADGLDSEITRKADKTLSLSKLTYPHSLARVILVEQLYRAQCIIRDHPYHRE